MKFQLFYPKSLFLFKPLTFVNLVAKDSILNHRSCYNSIRMSVNTKGQCCDLTFSHTCPLPSHTLLVRVTECRSQSDNGSPLFQYLPKPVLQMATLG